MTTAPIDYSNPNRLEEKLTDTSSCPGCGANLTFDPENGNLRCEHCGSIVNFEIEKSQELDFGQLADKNDSWSDETHVFTCNNCGAKQVLEKSDIAKSCVFCGTTNIVETNEISGLRPNAVVPFRLKIEAACEKAIRWAKKKLFAPSKFKKSINPDEVAGTYNPAFTFDANTTTHYHGKLARTETYTVRQNGKTVTKTRTIYYNISGTYSSFFDDILVQASSTISQKNIDKLQPFNTNESKEYSKDFLRGYKANQYNKDGNQCWSEARRIIDDRIKKAILSKYTYTRVVSFKASTVCKNVTYKYLLLPIYIGHFGYKRKYYNFFVNGYSGKVSGKTPISPLRVFIAALIGTVIVGGIVALGILLL